MNTHSDRRRFCKTIAALGAGALSPSRGQSSRKLRIGHTGITWRNDIEQAISDIAGLGFHGFETFGNVIENLEAKGGIGPLLDAHKLPLISAYCGCNLTDPSKRSEEIRKMVRWGNLLKKYGGKVAVIGPNGVKREDYDFASVKSNIVATLNEVGKALTDAGVLPVLHQHTGTSVETREETYAVMESVDTRYVKFGPDIGQLQKGGADPVKVVKDFLPIVHHMHLKDYSGGESFLGYCPLGRGKVDIPAILSMMESVEPQGMIMVELDAGRDMPMPALETARIAREYLERQGYRFRGERL
jgi:inosose dehydratase